MITGVRRPRPCRPCAAYAATAALYGQKVRQVQPGRFRVQWPPRGHWADQAFTQCRKAIVWTCAAHVRWTVWPSDLYLALVAETEDLNLSAVAPLSGLDDMLRAKAAGAVPKSRTMYGAWPGEDPAAVIAAYRETGSYAAAGRLLDVRGVPTRKGGLWYPAMVAWIVQLQGVQP